MFSYLFLLAATVAAETPNIELSSAEAIAIQEIVTVLAQEDITAAITTQPDETTVQSDAIKAQFITITNAIEPSMLEYKHWTGKYSPESFSITINGIEIESGKTAEIPAGSKTVEIGYAYSFMNGMKSGGRKISYELHENSTQAQITFNWKDDLRIILDNGKVINNENY